MSLQSLCINSLLKNYNLSLEDLRFIRNTVESEISRKEDIEIREKYYSEEFFEYLENSTFKEGSVSGFFIDYKDWKIQIEYLFSNVPIVVRNGDHYWWGIENEKIIEGTTKSLPEDIYKYALYMAKKYRESF